MKTAEQIKEARITPPRSAQSIIPRGRLINSLKNNADKNLILVYSPAGYGKTVLIKDYLSNQVKNFAWLNVSPDIDHIYTFFNYLIHALKRINNNFGENTAQMIESCRLRYQLSKNLKKVTNDIVSTFINEFNRCFNDDVTLVFDDFHHIEESKWASEVFSQVFNNIPSNLHLIIITRHLPDFNFAPLLTKGKMFKIEMEDLIFHFNEIIELLENIYSIKYSEDDIKLLENNLGGWITGIHLILQSFGKDFNKIKLDYQRIPENTFNFLANEIYRRFDTETQNFLMSTALLDDFNEDICNHILSIKNSGAIIDNFLSKNQFIQTLPVSNEENTVSNTYSYQVLFKKFLVSRVYETKTESEINNLLRRVFEYYQERGEIIPSLHYIVLAKDYETAVPLIIQNFQKLFSEGKFEFLWKWLSLIEKESALQNPHIIYYLGVLYKYFAGDLETSLEYLQNAISRLDKKSDHQTLIKCHITRAGVLLNLGRTQEALTELSELIKEPTSQENRASLLYFLAYAYYGNSEYDTSLELLNQSLEISEKENLNEVRTDSLNLMGHIDLIKGEYKKSIYYYEKIANNNSNVIDRFETLCNLVLLSSQSAKYDKAGEFLNKLDELINKFPTPIFRMPYLLAKQAYLYESGNFRENIDILNEINSIALNINHKKYIYICHRLLTDSYYHLNDLTKAQENYELAVRHKDDKNQLENIELSVVKATILKKKENDKSIEKILIDAYEYYDSNGFVYSKAQTCFHLADYYYRTGKLDNLDKALKYLEECLNISSEKDYVSYLQREMRRSKELFDLAEENKMHKEFLNQLKKTA
ncbi:MAG: hypothetical protein ACRDFC_06560 [Ignavibacteria bacterium]